MDWREENKLKQEAQESYEKEFSYNQVYIQGYSNGYNNAINEFIEALKKESFPTHENHSAVWLDSALLIAERMKENKHGIYKNISI